MTLKEPLNTEILITFLTQIIKYRKKIILIVDNLSAEECSDDKSIAPMHHSCLVKEWVEQNKHRIELYYLPAYCNVLRMANYSNESGCFDERSEDNQAKREAVSISSKKCHVKRKT